LDDFWANMESDCFLLSHITAGPVDVRILVGLLSPKCSQPLHNFKLTVNASFLRQATYTAIHGTET
jgi:hypothetical protein